MIRETFESAMLFGGAIFEELGVDSDDIFEISREIRERDKERFETEVAADDVYAGVGLQYTRPRPTAPLLPLNTRVKLLMSKILNKIPQIISALKFRDTFDVAIDDSFYDDMTYARIVLRYKSGTKSGH